MSYFWPTSLHIVEYICRKLTVPMLMGEKWGASRPTNFGSARILFRRRGVSYSTPQMNA